MGMRLCRITRRREDFACHYQSSSRLGLELQLVEALDLKRFNAKPKDPFVDIRDVSKAHLEAAPALRDETNDKRLWRSPTNATSAKAIFL